MGKSNLTNKTREKLEGLRMANNRNKQTGWNNMRAWEMSVSKQFAKQVRGVEFGSQHPYESAGCGGMCF